MSDVFFPPARFAAPAAAAASSGVAATITHPPPATAALATGAIIRGTVTGTDAKGQILVKTDFGVLPLQTKAKLATGSQVTLQVRVAGSELHVVILRVETGKDAPPRQGGDPGAQGRLPAAPQSLPAGAAPDEVAGDRLLRALVEQPAAAAAKPAAAAAAKPALTPGGEVLLRILSIQTPGPAQGPGAAPAPPATAAPNAGLPGLTGSQPALPGGAAQAAPAGAQRLEGVLLPTAGDQGARIETAQGTLRLALQTALPPGTRLVIEVTPTAAAAPEAAPEPPVQASGLARGWPALEEALRLLQPGEQQVAGMTLGSHALPRPGPRFASTLLFFMSALRGGGLAAWLSGTAAQALERAGRGDLVSRLKQDFGRMSRLAAEPAPGEWRGYLIPVLDATGLGQARVFIRRPEDEAAGGGEAPETRSTRFVVEVSMSRFGDLQLDGLIRDKRFDLILRSRAPLPPNLRREITEIYESAGETTGYRGQLVFQASKAWTALPLDAAAGGEAAVVV